MSNKKAPAPTVAHGSIAAPSLSTADEATQFLELLGKDPATTRLRAFPHKESTNKAKIAARKGEWDLEQAATWNREGRGVFVVTGNGGDKKEDITSCPALFVEWDDQPIEWQLTAWIELGLPEPTMQVPTGGRSVHNWWVMTEPISPAEFEALQIRLYTHCKSDELKDPSRVMRLPGFAYIGPDDKPAGLVELVNVTGNRYSAAEIEACLPALPAPAPAKAVAAVPSRKFTPRSIDEVNAAATFVPRRVGNEGTYESDRNALCGCSAALAEAGHSDPDGAALALLEDKWPPGDARQALKSATTRNAASFWAIAREHGYDLKGTGRGLSVSESSALTTVEPNTPAEPPKSKNDSFTHQRVKFLAAALRDQVRADYEQASAWLHFDGTKWASHYSNDKVNELMEGLYDSWGWTVRDSTTVNGDRAGLRRAIGGHLPSATTWLLPFTNCCLDLHTKEVVPHSPEHGNRYCLPFDYKPGQPAPQAILSFLEDRFGSLDVLQLFQAFIWHILTGTAMKAYLEITGPGNTGKTVITNLVIALIGVENTTSCSLKRIEDPNNKFETNRLRSKRLAVFSESQEYSGSLEMLKALTGQDRISAERKFSPAVFDHVFVGGVILTGNSPVRVSDTSGAVINRRRSIIVDKVVEAVNERVLIEFDGSGALRGELVHELPALIDWVLAMPPAEARRAIARDVASSARADAEKKVLLKDHLANWANERLIFNDCLDSQGKPMYWSQVGNLDSAPSQCLLANYRTWLQERETARAYGQTNFKHKLVDLLRDTLGLPLPPGDHSKGLYRVDGIGSVVPFVRLRLSSNSGEQPGVIDAAFAKRVAPLGQRVANDQNPVGNGTNGSNDKLENHLPCEMEIGQEGSNREVGVEKTRLTHLFHWTEGSQRLSPVCQPLGSGADAFGEGDDPSWGPRQQ